MLDIGCGTADILECLPDVDYTGFDSNAQYIDWAIARHGERGRFFCQNVSPSLLQDLGSLDRGSFDLVVANGVLHHLNDEEARSLFMLAKEMLRPGARLITFDGCYVKKQHPLSAYLLSRDRGRFVRTCQAYLHLAEEVFPNVSGTLHHDLLRVPYSHLIMECHGDDARS